MSNLPRKHSLWDDIFEEPIFVLTSDQDWAPGWAARMMLDVVARDNVPLHSFRTNPCAVLDRAFEEGAITQGWHPNFLPESSHGRTTSEVIDYCRGNFPASTTLRSHTFHENTWIWKELAEAGIIADSQLATLYQPEICPILHWTGIIRFPVFFEDDVFFEHESKHLAFSVIERFLFSPGLKVLNFHPTFVACNIPSRHYYESVRSKIFGSTEPATGVIWNERGTRHVLEEVIQCVRVHQYEFTPFMKLVELTQNHIAKNADRFPHPFSKRPA